MAVLHESRPNGSESSSAPLPATTTSTSASGAVDPVDGPVGAIGKVPGSPDGSIQDGKRTFTKKEERLGMIRFITLCWTLFLAGWNDGTIGPLVPRLREEYNVGNTSLWIFFATGFFALI